MSPIRRYESLESCLLYVDHMCHAPSHWSHVPYTYVCIRVIGVMSPIHRYELLESCPYIQVSICDWVMSQYESCPNTYEWVHNKNESRESCPYIEVPLCDWVMSLYIRISTQYMTQSHIGIYWHMALMNLCESLYRDMTCSWTKWDMLHISITYVRTGYTHSCTYVRHITHIWICNLCSCTYSYMNM